MSGLLIFIIILLGVYFIWKGVRPYLYLWMQRRTEDYLRNAMGMPPRGESRSGRGRKQSASGGSRSGFRGNASQKHTGSIIPKEYAVDVEYTEIRSYSEETIAADGSSVKYSVESQVSEAEIIEIRKDS